MYMEDIGKEMDQSFRGQSRMFGDNEFTNYMSCFADAYRQNAETLQRPVQQLTLIDKLVTHSSWTAASVRLFLRKNDIAFTAEVEKVIKAVRKRSDAPYPEMKITYDYLREYIAREQVTEETIIELIRFAIFLCSPPIILILLCISKSLFFFVSKFVLSLYILSAICIIE